MQKPRTLAQQHARFGEQDKLPGAPSPVPSRMTGPAFAFDGVTAEAGNLRRTVSARANLGLSKDLFSEARAASSPLSPSLLRSRAPASATSIDARIAGASRKRSEILSQLRPLNLERPTPLASLAKPLPTRHASPSTPRTSPLQAPRQLARGSSNEVTTDNYDSRDKRNTASFKSSDLRDNVSNMRMGSKIAEEDVEDKDGAGIDSSAKSSREDRGVEPSSSYLSSLSSLSSSGEAGAGAEAGGAAAEVEGGGSDSSVGKGRPPGDNVSSHSSPMSSRRNSNASDVSDSSVPRRFRPVIGGGFTPVPQQGSPGSVTPKRFTHQKTSASTDRKVRLAGTGVMPNSSGGLLRLELSELGTSCFDKVFHIEEDLAGGTSTPLPRPPEGHRPRGRRTDVSGPRFFPKASVSNSSLASSILDQLCRPTSWVPPKPFSPAPVSSTDMRTLCKDVFKIINKEPTVIRTRAPIKVFGDIHGQFNDLLSFFAVHGQPYPPHRSDIQGFRYLFNGDFVDRGPHSLEVVALLFALKIQFPKQVYLIRGNHESSETNRTYGFFEECTRRYRRGEGELVWRIINKVFHQLPLAAVLDHRILVLHGGLGPDVSTIADIEKIKRGTTTIEGPKSLEQILWADPKATDSETGYSDNPERGCSVTFGADISRAFRSRNKLDLIIRSHEPVGAGFEWFEGGHLVTVFSAVNYTGTRHNFGAMLLVDNTLKVEPRMIPPEFERLDFIDGNDHVPQERPPTPERSPASKAKLW